MYDKTPSEYHPEHEKFTKWKLTLHVEHIKLFTENQLWVIYRVNKGYCIRTFRKAGKYG